MSPKVSQLLTRVLDRQPADDGGSSSASEDGMDLKHLAANASAGLRMEMQMVLESRARDAEAGVDKTACIVDRNQFFNTQVGVGYQHKSVVRQRTAEVSGSGAKVVDMSVPKAPASAGRKRGRHETRESVSDGGDSSDGERRRKGKKRSKDKKAKKRVKDKEGKASHGEKQRKSKKKREKGSKHRHHGRKASRRRDEKSKEEKIGDIHEGGGSSSSRKQKRKSGKGDSSAPNALSEQVSSASSTGDSSDSDPESSQDESRGGTTRSQPEACTPCGVGCEARASIADEQTMAKAMVPLQQLRDLIEERWRRRMLQDRRVQGDSRDEA